MSLEVHGHEAGELNEARIDAAHEAGLWKRHNRDHVTLEPRQWLAHRELVDGGGVTTRVDRAAHQGQRGGLDRHVALGHDGGGGEGWNRWLAYGHDVGIRTQVLHEVDDVVDEIIEGKPAVGDRHLPGILPVRDVDVVLGEHRFYGAAQQRRVMARHRRDDQHLGIVALAGSRLITGEVNEVAEWLGERQLFGDADLEAVDRRSRYVERGLAVALGQTFEDFEACRNALGEGVQRERAERIIECEARCRRPEPHRCDEGVGQFVSEIVQVFYLSALSACSETLN